MLNTEILLIQIPHAVSYRNPLKKNDVLNTLVNRAIYVSDKEHWFEEKTTLKHALTENGNFYVKD